MAANEITAMTANGDDPASVPRRRATVTRLRAAGMVWICLLACFRFAGIGALAQDTAPVSAPGKFDNSDCLDCHLDPNTTRVVKGKTESLVFPTNTFAHSVHAKLACVDCHPGIKDLVHESPLPPPHCTP